MLKVRQPSAALWHLQGADKAARHADGGGGTLVGWEQKPGADARKDRVASCGEHGRVGHCEREDVRQLQGEALARNVCMAQGREPVPRRGKGSPANGDAEVPSGAGAVRKATVQVDERRRRGQAAQKQTVRLADVQASAGCRAERQHRLPVEDSDVGGRAGMQAGVVCVLVCGRRRGAVGLQQRSEGVSALELPGARGKRLRRKDVQQVRQRVALTNAAGGEPVVGADGRLGAGKQQPDPGACVRPEAERGHAGVQPLAVEAIKDFGKVQERDGAGLLDSAEVINLTQVEEDVIANPSAMDERRLCVASMTVASGAAKHKARALEAKRTSALRSGIGR